MKPTPERFNFFWHGPFSQWHMCDFEVDQVGYNCAEQYMMAQKALFFADQEYFELIMASFSPREQKALGRMVEGFDPKRWNASAREIVYRGNWAKFTQNDDLKALLLATQGTTLVEASPTDTIWGIGLAEDDPRAHDRKTWRGQNWLGEVLTRVREDILGAAGEAAGSLK